MEVEGSWNNFDIKILQDVHIPSISSFLDLEFHKDEPITGNLQIDPAYISLINRKISQKLKENQNLSLIAFDKSTGEISGLQLVFIWHKNDALAEINAHLEGKTAPVMSDAAGFNQRRVQDAIYIPLRSEQYGMFDKYGVEEVAWNFIASTGRKWRGMGLASELHRRMALNLRSRGIQIAFSIFSSPFSRRSGEKCGFVELARTYYGSAKDPQGNLVLPDATGEEDYASLMVLVL